MLYSTELASPFAIDWIMQATRVHLYQFTCYMFTFFVHEYSYCYSYIVYENEYFTSDF